MAALCRQPVVRVDLVDVDGTSALLLAAQRGHDECVRRLIGAHASPNLPRADGLRALHYAALGGHAACAAALLDARADSSARDRCFRPM